MLRPLALLLVALLPVLAGCAHDFDVERRQTPVHVWLTIPAMAAQGGQIQALVYVGPYKVVEGLVTFPKGITTVRLPSVHMRSGNARVSAVLRGGRPSLAADVSIKGDTWIHVELRGENGTIQALESQPVLATP